MFFITGNLFGYFFNIPQTKNISHKHGAPCQSNKASNLPNISYPPLLFFLSAYAGAFFLATGKMRLAHFPG
jgi:hypothetical protein